MTYEPLHHKYRPQTFAELVGQEAIAATLSNALRQQKIAPAYLFTGARGTGKTSSARILAKSLNCLVSNVPTAQPCGKCEVCRAIANGSALDIIEIDAASNTGVDNIRDLIEKAQFAPVQCRYKVYVVDECLTGDTLVTTDAGLYRIDDPRIKGTKVLSYNEAFKEWEFKPVARWLDQGERQTYTIETEHYKIKCTDNHLIRTATGWIAAKDIREGTKILSPVNADAAQQWHTNLEAVKSVSLAGVERVYDIEVEDNHNFVANGLLVHNCHMLSTAAFNALLKTLEEPPDRVVFVLATTDPQRVLPTIISRCQRFDFRRIPLMAMVEHLTTIAAKEKIPIAADALTLVAQIAQGGLRDAESLLDQLSLLSGEIAAEQVWDLVGSVPERDLLSLLEAIAQDDPETMLDSTRRLMDRGREPLIVLQNLASFYRDLLIAKTAPDRHDLIAVTLPTWERLCQFAQQLEIGTILLGQQHLRSAEVQLKNTTQPRLWLEITLMGLLPSAIAGASGTPHQASSQSAPDRVSPARNDVRPATPPPRTTPAVERSPDPPISQPPTVTPQAQPSPVSELPAEPEVPPQAIPTPPPAAATPAANAEDIDLEQVWQKVLGLVQPYSTQIMLRQQCQLLGFNGQEARIGARSQKLFSMAKERLPNVEAAFAQFCQHPVRVGLEVMLAGDSSPPAAPSAHSTLDSGISKPQRNAPPEPPPSQRSPMPQPPEPPPAIEAITPNYQATPPSSPLLEAPDTLPPTGIWHDDPVTQAAKQLADFFAGKVVDIEDDAFESGSTFATDDLTLETELDDAQEEPIIPEPSQLSQVPQDSLPNAATEVTHALEDDEDEDDIPF
ncbi:DNA polymerase III subunit gamma/tau [Pantanalinema sp. GBBB05]|uniref:DNA polymerase III subunit gamma/tau n=1 Tax=Pantanalinema sp. GBBB05 TaxID=2604139 RepID=UPI001DC310A1|nr:DNA polymerase III subunit gamma/tau [Pantanalinema sp. GBBB05]